MVIPKEVSSLMGVIDTYKRWKHHSQSGDREYFYYHPSEWGKCLRYQQYKHYAQRGYIEVEHTEMNSKLLRLFDKGHNMHERWASYFDDIGNVLMGEWKCQNVLCRMFDDNGNIITSDKERLFNILKNEEPRIHRGQDGKPIFKPKKCVCGCEDFKYLETLVYREDLQIKGHADLVLNFENIDLEKFKKVKVLFNKKYLPTGNDIIVGDMKTSGSNAWKSQVMLKGAHKAYLIQLTIYIHILGCKYGVVMYENKDTSELAWFQVTRNEQWWDLVQWQAAEMIKMRNNRLLPPPKAENKSDYMCKDCEFRNLCHKSSVWQDPKLESQRKLFYKSFL